MLQRLLALILFLPFLGYAEGKVVVSEVSGVINPIIARYIENTIARAEKEKAELLIIQIDTPGGLVTSTHEITKSLLNCKIPVATYISPKGARAASAGVFICLASDIIAMASSTHIGAAHPVGLGQEIGKDASKKITNDLVAEIKGIAKEKGRNIEWAEKAVRESVAITEEEAINLKIADIIANDLDELLEKLEGRVVKKNAMEIVLHTKGKEIVKWKMSFREGFLHALAEPNIAYVFLMLGIYGLIYEFSSPGIGLGAVMGSICLILAFFGLSNLSINLAGLFLIVLGFILLIAEIKAQSHGILTIGGAVALTLGSFMLIDSSSAPAVAISKSVILSMVITTIAIFFLLISLGIFSQFRKVKTGKEGMIGEIGIVKGNRLVFVDGEIWQARCYSEIEEGERVEVIGVDGLVLLVKKFTNEAFSSNTSL
ncbi:MAG: nodulation protein NfeD [bacterium]|nr:nodulation protein NfeD [bacterium]